MIQNTAPLNLFLIGMGAALLTQCGAPDSNNTDEKPNVILIMSDDMGYSDIGCYGSEIETPELDNLAANGLRFSQFYNTARCCPSRASLLTGLYPAQTGMGFMTGDEGEPGYQGEIGNQCVTIAEVLKPAGYHTYMSGKWHVARNLKDIDSLKYNWPLQRGFDKFYGTIIGAGSLWDPWTLTRGNTFITPYNDPEYDPEEPWYYTDAISDNAMNFIEEHDRKSEEDPFFMYVAYTAAHWPMHAPEEEIALHEGKYDEGYAPIREKRYQNLIEKGLIDKNWQLSEQVAQWDTVKNKSWHARNMEVYAAMITRMDKGIGRIVDELKEKDMLDNTLILFLQDNGGCAETLGWLNESEHPYDTIPEEPVYEPMGKDELQTRMFPKQTRDGYPVVVMSKKAMAGPSETYHAYGPNWANVSNTPFRKYKHWVHEGGVATPLIAHWPEKIKDKGQIRRQPSHLIDIMATIVDITEAEYPENYKGHQIQPMEGKSLMGVFTENEAIDREAIYFEHEGNRAIRKGKWKLVSKAYPSAGKFRRMDTIPMDQWVLYNIEEDRTETNDLADQYPEKVKKMAAQWQEWAKRTNTIPKPK
ncbi:MAG: arylsulfatase [Bacteroidales bacterium]|nr:arylsulfatase [Bacteroidales bacterium]